MNIFSNKGISIRLLAETDIPLLIKWLSDSRVLKYYEGRDRPHDYELLRENFFDPTQEITQYIILYKDQEIGYIQYYEITEEERQEYGYEEFNGKIYGMDQFIGEVDYWNKGIGTELIKWMVENLINHEKVDKIVMDPQAWNKRALRVYEKCGFIKKKYLPEHEWHEGEYRDCWIIEFES